MRGPGAEHPCRECQTPIRWLVFCPSCLKERERERERARSASRKDYFHEYWQQQKTDRLAGLYAIIRDHPGITVDAWALRAGVTIRVIESAMLDFEEVGFLLYEEDGGRLYPYEEGL